MRLCTVFVCFLLFAGALACSAEQLSSEIEKKDPKAETLEWKAVMAENSYNLRESPEGKIKALKAYEDYANYLCLSPMLKTLEYSGSTISPKCQELIDKLLKYNNDNAVALCIRDGIDATSCRDAYFRQVAQPYSNSSKNDTVFSDREEESRIFKEIYRLEAEYKEEKSFEKLQEITNNFRKVLNIYCNFVDFNFQSREQVLGISVKDLDMSPMQALLKKLDKNPDKEQSPLIKLPRETQIRVRLLSKRCDDNLNRLLRIDPFSSLAVCHRDGFYSPFCIDAKREERKVLKVRVETKKREIKEEKGPELEDGLEPF